MMKRIITDFVTIGKIKTNLFLAFLFQKVCEWRFL